ncbi:MAG: hypothetical protein R3C99_21340 [Pirellulaceae bacterium]
MGRAGDAAQENDRLSDQQIEDVRRWIAGGAPWPDEQRLAELVRTTADKWHAAEGVSVPTSGGLKGEWTHRKYQPENLWAYRPLWQNGRTVVARRTESDRRVDRQASG